MKRRFFINKVHFYLALISTVPVFILCITGSILVYKEAIDVYFTRPYTIVEARETKLPVAELEATLKAELPGKEFAGVIFPEEEGRSYFFWLKDAPFWTVAYIDPYTGTFKGLRAWEDWTMANIIWWTTDLHTSFKWGNPGSYVVAACSVVLLLSVLTGLYLWWPRKSKFDKTKFTLRLAKRWKQTAFNLHAVLGFYASVLLIAITLTGLTIAFNEPFSGFIHALTLTPKQEHPKPVKAEEGKPYLSTEEIIAIGLKALQDKYGMSPKPQSMNFPTPDNVVVEIGLQGKSDYADADHSHVFVNAQSGEVVAIEAAPNRTGAENFVSWMAAIHYGTWGAVFGKYGDIPTRIIWLAAALMPLFLIISGYSFVKKKRWKSLWRK